MNSDYVFVLDFDGVLTDGKMYYTENGKWMKVFGSDDWDLLKFLSKYIEVHIITADQRGFEITKKRVEEEMKLPLSLVRGNSFQRWQWIKNEYPDKKIIFMGDSLSDVHSLKHSDISFTTSDSLYMTQLCADHVTFNHGSERAVAEAIISINEELAFFEIEDYLGGEL